MLQARQLFPPRLYLPPVRNASEVISALALPIVIRALMGSGPNAENNREKTLPFLSVPERAMYIFGHPAEKREYPIAFATPRSARILANDRLRA